MSKQHTPPKKKKNLAGALFEPYTEKVSANYAYLLDSTFSLCPCVSCKVTKDVCYYVPTY